MFVLPARMPRKRAANSKPRGHPERDLQEAVATYLRRVLAAPTFFSAISHGVVLGKTPEERRRRGAQLKKAGHTPGVPDLLIIDRGRCLFIELKSKGGSLNDDQKIAHPWITAAGACVTVCRSVEDVRDRLEVWGVPTLESRLPPAERAVLFAQYRAS